MILPILVRPTQSEQPPPFNLQSALRTYRELWHCSQKLKALSESISQHVSQKTSLSCSPSKAPASSNSSDSPAPSKEHP